MTVLDRAAETGAFAPQLWPIEALNGLLMAEWRGRIDGSIRRRLAAFLQDLPIRVDDQTAFQVWSATATLAESHCLTAYDATCLELAMRLGLPLATNAKPLATAAQAIGIALIVGAEQCRAVARGPSCAIPRLRSRSWRTLRLSPAPPGARFASA
jgi:predicted nucleic acid-binding protein